MHDADLERRAVMQRHRAKYRRLRLLLLPLLVAGPVLVVGECLDPVPEYGKVLLGLALTVAGLVPWQVRL